MSKKPRVVSKFNTAIALPDPAAKRSPGLIPLDQWYGLMNKVVGAAQPRFKQNAVERSRPYSVKKLGPPPRR